MSTNKKTLQKRRNRVRKALRRNENTRARLSVHRSGQNIYAQIIDDTMNVTIASASSIDKDMKSKLKSGSDTKAATEIGKLIAKKAIAAGVKEVVFDRGAFVYHGRIKALAEAAREGGLIF
ncbi:MAG: 50S ribosomal protein L18 [bacterium]|nr:50S ribosomal protein L18 [bacterium]